MDERVLTERMITYDTSTVEGLRACAGFIKGWLEARDIAVEDHQFGDVFALTASNRLVSFNRDAPGTIRTSVAGWMSVTVRPGTL